jgi:hypothetical protein
MALTHSHLSVADTMRELINIRSDLERGHPYYLAVQSAILHLEEINPTETSRLDSVMRGYDRAK